MSAALRLVCDSHGCDQLPPLEAWELFMRGAGRSERTVRDGIATMRRLEQVSGKDCTEIRAVDVSRLHPRVLHVVGRPGRTPRNPTVTTPEGAERHAAAGVRSRTT
ncbi:hypothetical protein [Mycobacterium marinum]|uniref:hypothetical protein n=1 Tax=Mycobacterium marinum TaxID=1781 RepID=UPI000E3D52B4|nr:hypothetical protein [Mycobacterium marinum]RFZ08107.1 hypothetical protein VIMS_04156 [Mycobacterium marinum]WCS20118.1 hypothetical protein MML61_10075 [Mycobacterium marinum]